MPYINIRVGCLLNSRQRQTLHETTTELMSSIMGKKSEVTVVHIQESKPHQWSTNGSTLSSKEPVAAYVDIKITKDTNNPEQKAEMILQTVSMLKKVVGTVQEACYVVIDDIPANSWGYNGQTQAMRIAEI